MLSEFPVSHDFLKREELNKKNKTERVSLTNAFTSPGAPVEKFKPLLDELVSKCLQYDSEGKNHLKDSSLIFQVQQCVSKCKDNDLNV